MGNDHLFNSIASILTAIVGVAILAVIVSKNANTAGVITAGGTAFATALGAAEAPVTGGGGLGLSGIGSIGSANNFTLF